MSFQFDHWEIHDLLRNKLATNKPQKPPNSPNKDENQLSLPSTCPNSRDNSLSSQQQIQKKKKQLQFSRVCSVILIPTKEEFKEAGCDLWYPKPSPATLRWDYLDTSDCTSKPVLYLSSERLDNCPTIIGLPPVIVLHMQSPEPKKSISNSISEQGLMHHDGYEECSEVDHSSIESSSSIDSLDSTML